MTTPLGDTLNSLAMTHDLDDGELVAGAITILKIIDADGDVLLRFITSDGLAVFERIGMLRTAEAVELRDALT